MEGAVRPATMGELSSDAARRLLARCVGDATPAGLERARQVYDRGARLYIYAVGDAISGLMGIGELPDGRKEILHIAVASGAERQGIGRRLVRHACEELRARTVSAETDRDAVGFYRALGFATTSLGETYPGRQRFRCAWSCSEGTLTLVAARSDDGLDLWSMLQEIPKTESGFGNGAHGLPLQRWQEHLERVVAVSHGEVLEPGQVPQTTFWLWSDRRPAGMSKLRHGLNDRLLRHGGHIGYGIRPSERGKGYGNAILRLTLRWARLYGLRRVLLTCDSANRRSRMVIERNGGTLEDETDGNCRYWIDLA